MSDGQENNTYRVDLGGDRPVILRIAFEPGRQARSERELMRNEHASVPFLAPIAPIAPMIPHTLAADFTHEIIGRDYLFQTMLDGGCGPGRHRPLPPASVDGVLPGDGRDRQSYPRRPG
ncbi:phosphotransferase [Saccharopolyspora hattusasensis]|uniref:phosphotransferase n=1 Tax=Saccharopolyspora hattusasensis TaxID=1128679 RepID=UPI003D95EDC1